MPQVIRKAVAEKNIILQNQRQAATKQSCNVRTAEHKKIGGSKKPQKNQAAENLVPKSFHVCLPATERSCIVQTANE